MTTTEPTTEEAFWVAIGAASEDQLPRLVFADWLEERAKVVECKRCDGYGQNVSDGRTRALVPCDTCQGTGYIPDRNGRMAAALRATVDRVPLGNGGTAMSPPFGWYGGYAGGIHPESDLPRPVFSRLIGDSGGMENFRMYPTAAAAIRDLCEAWCKVNYGEVRE